MPASYDQHGISFLYPENWQLIEDRDGRTAHSVTAQSPDGGYWEMQMYPPAVSPSELVETALQAMRDVYEEIEVEEVVERLHGSPAIGYDLHFFCLDLLVTGQLRAFQRGAYTCLITYQAESREFDRLIAVFGAITKSFFDRGG